MQAPPRDLGRGVGGIALGALGVGFPGTLPPPDTTHYLIDDTDSALIVDDTDAIQLTDDL